ncbi:hypothetical protein D3C78_936680 [compost metagenome]
MTDHERASIPSAIFIYRDEGPPDHVLVVVDHQIFLEVNRAPLGHVELVESQGAFHRSTLDHPGNIPQLGDVESAPIHAWQVPLQTRTEQTTFELEQTIFPPSQPLTVGGDFPVIAFFIRLVCPADSVAF